MSESIPTPNDLLTALDSREALFGFLRRKLQWQLDPDDPYTYPDDKAVGRAAARAQLSQILPFSSGDPFVIFLVEFETRFLRGDLRDILRGVRARIREEVAYNNADLDEMVFVCRVPDTVDADGKKHPAELRFVHFEERENRQPKLRVFGFDRESVGETHTLRAVNLSLLRLTTNLLGEVDWSACKKNWMEAWNVEKVTKQFFKDYKKIFDNVRDNYISGVTGEKQLFTQRLFNRLMFIHFLSKKGWLEFDGRKDYLFALRDAARAKNENLFHDRLYWAFFNGLGVQAGATPETHSLADLELLRGKVPYLNGGLFEMSDADDVRGSVTVKNEAFDLIFDGLFSCYNFTIAESSPDDADVAVDPEMLGKVFEELVTGRHESGSYYTPRPVVQFMCREALKGYLAPCGAGIETFVDNHDAGEITNHEAILTALKSVKVVDPACGSGAYLLGMLQELMALRLVLFNAKRLDDESTYKRKLEIIQNNIYGVDLDIFAVNTARLRLWLSLVVEQKTNPLDNPNVSVALPNLDFKIEVGDSVCCPDPSGGLQLSLFREADLRTLADKRLQYGDVSFKGNKSALKGEIELLSREIKVEAKLAETAFDWRVDFGEVFRTLKGSGGSADAVHSASGETVESRREASTAEGFHRNPSASEKPGFDIVLANPPYVRGELIKDQKPF